MSMVAFFSFVIIPFAIAMTTRYWFPLFPFVKRLRDHAQKWDIEPFPSPKTKNMTFKKVRTTESRGDKTVVTHHLAQVSRDLEDKIFSTMLKSTILAIVVVLFVAVAINSKTQPPQVKPPGFFESLQITMAELPIFFVIPVSFFVFIISSVVEFFAFRDQVLKYRNAFDQS